MAIFNSYFVNYKANLFLLMAPEPNPLQMAGLGDKNI